MTGTDRGAAALCLILAAGALSAILSVWVFRNFADLHRMRGVMNRILAHLVEFRLFADEPALIFRAQRDLLRANASLLRCVLVPSLILLVPFALLLTALDALYGHSPLIPGDTSILTGRYSARLGLAILECELKAPAGIAVETPPVRVPVAHEVSWRLRAVRPVSGDLQLRFGERTVTKTICTRPGVHWLSDRRTRIGPTFLHPFELPLADSDLEFITIRYPVATVFHFHWFFWFFVGSLVGLVLKYAI